jgi:hypothetical protein
MLRILRPKDLFGERGSSLRSELAKKSNLGPKVVIPRSEATRDLLRHERLPKRFLGFASE